MKDFSVVIIGAGPAGIGAASKLLKSGVKSVTIIERSDKVGGIPSFYKRKKGGVRTFMRWSWGAIPVFGQDFAAWLEKRIESPDVDLKLNSLVLEIDPKTKSVTYVNAGEGKQTISADAVIMACGAREKNVAERKWVAGSRPSRVMFTKHLLSLETAASLLPMKKPLVIGSDVIAYAAAAKLKRAGAADPVIIDNRKSPECPIHERAYFRLFGKFPYRGNRADSVEVRGTKSAEGVDFADRKFDSDGVVVSGELVPNSELALLGDLKVNIPSRVPVVGNNSQLSEPGWFVAGNVRGGFHGGEWCFFDGRRAAQAVIKSRNP